MGGAERDRRTAKICRHLDGLGLGLLIVISHLAIFSKINVVWIAEMPTLKIVNDVSPVLAIFMALIFFGMIFNTAVSIFYAFTARFVEMRTKQANLFILITVVVGFVASFVGFTDLVAFFYPLIGYLGLFLIGALIYAPFKLAKDEQ